MVQLALKKQLCSLSVCAMWPLSGTFFRCSRQLCSQVSSHINDSLYWFGVEQIEDRTPTRACDSLHYIEGRSPEKDSCWIWNRSHQKKLDAVRFYIFTVTDLIGKEHKTHYLALSIIELYFGSCLNVYLCQEKKWAQIYHVLLCCCIFRFYVRIWLQVWSFIILFLLLETVKPARCLHWKLLISSC